MMKFNKINFGLLMLFFLCRFENILGASDKNFEEGLKEKYKIVDEKGTILKNEKNEDFSFIVTCKCEGNYYKWFEGIEFDIEKIEEEKDINNRFKMEEELKKKSGVSSEGDIVKTKDGRVLVVKDEIKNKVYLVLGNFDQKNRKTANIFLDKNYKLQTSSYYNIIKENNIDCVEIRADEDCGGVEVKEKNGVYKSKIVYCNLCNLKDEKPEVTLKKLDDFVENSCCCDCLGNWCKKLCP